MNKALDERSNFLKINKNKLENSAIAIIQAPYEHTVSYGGGTQNGPQAILDASGYVEFYDEEFDCELCFEKGITTFAEIELINKFDEAMLAEVEATVEKLLDKDKFVVTLGGEHTISIAPIAAHFKKYPNMSVLHFDAHSDLRTEYEGNKYSHASFMARVAEFLPTNRIVQVGIRALCAEEAKFIKKSGIRTYFAYGIRAGSYENKNNFNENIETVTKNTWQDTVIKDLGEEVYLTFDVDVLDPAIMPATGTPEPGGLFYDETINLFRKLIASGRKLIGFDVVELAPISGLSHPNLTAARLIYKLLNIAFQQ